MTETNQTGFERQHPAGPQHSTAEISAVIDTLPVKRKAIFKHKIQLFFASKDLRARGVIHRMRTLYCGDGNRARHLSTGLRSDDAGDLAQCASGGNAGKELLQQLGPFFTDAAAHNSAKEIRQKVFSTANIADHNTVATNTHPGIFTDLNFGFTGTAVAITCSRVPVDQHFFRPFSDKIDAFGEMSFGAGHRIFAGWRGIRAGTGHRRLHQVIPQAANPVFYRIAAGAADFIPQGTGGCARMADRRGDTRRHGHGDIQCAGLFFTSRLGRIKPFMINRTGGARGGFTHYSDIV